MKRTLISLLLVLFFLAVLAVPAGAIADVLTRMSVTGIILPKAGSTPSDHAQVLALPSESEKNGLVGADSMLPVTVDMVMWSDTAESELMLGKDTLFIPGHSYEVYLFLIPPETYAWNTWDGTTFRSDEAVMDIHVYSDEGEELPLKQKYIRADGTLILGCQVSCPSYAIGDVELDALIPVKPKDGARPNYDDYIATQGATLSETTWYDWTAGEYLSSDSAFVGGHEYQVIYHLQAAPGTEWALAKGSSTADVRPGAVTVSLWEDSVKIASQSDTDVNVQTGILSAAFKLTCEDTAKKLDSVTIGGLKAPVAGGDPQKSGFTLSIGKFLGVSPFTWVDATPGSEHDMLPGETFQAEHTYNLIFHIEAPDGCAWAKKSGTSNAAVAVTLLLSNGQPVTGQLAPTVGEVQGKKDVLTAAAEFTVAKSDPKPACTIKKQPVDIYAKSGSTVLFSVDAEGQGLSYQWHYAPEGGNSAPVLDNNAVSDRFSGAKTSILTLSNLTGNYSGWSFWCVISGPAGTTPVTTDRAKLTVTEGSAGTGSDTGVPVQQKVVFKDVHPDDWFHDWVYAAVDLGLINGKGKDAEGLDWYDPDGKMTLAEAVKLAACMHQLYTTGEVTLKNGDPWYETYADYGRKQGGFLFPGSSGYSYDTVMAYANEPITRMGFAWIFSYCLPREALAEINTIPENAIPDVQYDFESTVMEETRPPVEKNYGSIYLLYRAGILNGSDAKGTFHPESNIKRSEVAAIVVRMMKPEKRVGPPAELAKQ